MALVEKGLGTALEGKGFVATPDCAKMLFGVAPVLNGELLFGFTLPTLPKDDANGLVPAVVVAPPNPAPKGLPVGRLLLFGIFGDPPNPEKGLPVRLAVFEFVFTEPNVEKGPFGTLAAPAPP